MKTKCHKCIFATFDKNVQTGCLFERLDIFKESPETELVEEDGKKAYLIDRFCNTCRNKDWQKDFGTESLDECYEIVVGSIEKQADITIDATAANMDEIVLTIESAVSQAIAPKLIVIGVVDSVDMYLLLETMNKLCNPQNILFNIVKITEETNENKRLTMLVKRCKKPYYAHFIAGNEIPNNLLSELDRMINMDLRKISMIRPQHGLSGLVVQTALHNSLHLDDEYSIIDKIQYLADDQGREGMIMEWNDV